jgi:hypothetical protein
MDDKTPLDELAEELQRSLALLAVILMGVAAIIGLAVLLTWGFK